MARTREILLPWDSQPQEVVSGVNESSHLAVGLTGLWLPIVGTGYLDLSPYGNHITTKTGDPTFDNGDKASGWNFTTTQRLTGGASTPAFSAATGFSVAFWANADQTPGSYHSWISRGASTPNDWIIGPGAGGLKLLYSRNGAVLFNDTNNLISSARWVRAVLTVTPAGDAVWYKDGVTSTSGSSVAIQTSASGVWVNDRQTSTASGNATIGPFAFWDRPLSADEVASDYDNPWQLFAPRQIFIPTAAAGGTITATTSLSAAIQAALSKTASINAAIQQARSNTASADAAIQVARTVQSSLDAALQQARSATVDLSAYVQAGFTATVSADAAIQVARTGATSLDAAIQQARTATASITAAIQQARTAAASVNAYIQAGTTASASLSAAIQAAQSASASIDAAVATACSASASLGAAIALQMSISAAVDAAISASRSAVVGVGAYIYSDDLPAVFGSLVGSTRKTYAGRPSAVSSAVRRNIQSSKR